MGRRLEVKAVVDIPPFVALGRRDEEGRVLVDVEDFCAYLTTVAASFDEAGANLDIGRSLRAIRDGLDSPRISPRLSAPTRTGTTLCASPEAAESEARPHE